MRNMAVLNITYNGLSVDYAMPVDYHLGDSDIKRIAVEVIRAGEVKGLQIANLPVDAFEHYVVDRLQSSSGEHRIYLRPKVPFGG
jgi:hypothetical protein